jgi:holo-[acyl-carrier protein] synthase
MIVGLGSDLVDIRRVAATLERFGDRFTHRLFTADERRRCDRRAARAEGYARRFAAKEACAKALGTGFRQGVFWRDLEVINLPTGQPTMRLTGGALRRLGVILPPGTEPLIHVSLTDDPPIAQAIVIISASPPRA